MIFQLRRISLWSLTNILTTIFKFWASLKSGVLNLVREGERITQDRYFLMAFEFQVHEELRAIGVSQIQGLWVTKSLFPQDCLFFKKKKKKSICLLLGRVMSFYAVLTHFWDIPLAQPNDILVWSISLCCCEVIFILYLSFY